MLLGITIRNKIEERRWGAMALCNSPFLKSVFPASQQQQQLCGSRPNYPLKALKVTLRLESFSCRAMSSGGPGEDSSSVTRRDESDANEAFNSLDDDEFKAGSREKSAENSIGGTGQRFMDDIGLQHHERKPNVGFDPGKIKEQAKDSSLSSLEGTALSTPYGFGPYSHQLVEAEEDKSRISCEGFLSDGSEREAHNGSVVDADNQWKNVFPAYMQSRKDDSAVSGEDTVIGDGKNGCAGVNGTAAAKAAAAATASAKELEDRVNAFMIPELSPSVSAPPPSTAQHPTEGGINLTDLISYDPIWAAIRAEARLEAEREPLLSSFLYASILAHPCFERSLGFVLANRLKNATLLSTQLMDVLDDVFMHDSNIRQAIRLDVQAVKDRDPSCKSYSSALLYLKGYHALQSYRVAHALWERGQHVLALALQSRISEVFAVDIHPAARIGKAILLDHGTGVVIGETAVVGDRVSMLQGVTLGGTGKEAGDRHPKIGEGVLIGAGATILGNIKVGRGAMVAAGSLVLKDVAPHSMVAGTPARAIGTLEEPTPSLTMKHDATKNFCQELVGSNGVNAEDHLYGGAGI
ncbi:hypothetical protein O6H91_01G107900 [Diphasiastrum complanatum]|uniref:Uncharacterized protein n=1 Tax=Diphasiastrum complanatum TaxID=34168 RepID=A0ACC2EUK0_DIPCM|nr:hypothetical protein O6H91_01G107900 [Diphasiastrum complanatum]